MFKGAKSGRITTKTLSMNPSTWNIDNCIMTLGLRENYKDIAYLDIIRLANLPLHRWRVRPKPSPVLGMTFLNKLNPYGGVNVAIQCKRFLMRFLFR